MRLGYPGLFCYINIDEKVYIFIQLDLDNNIIKEWNSVTEAFKSLNKTNGMGNIHLCCKGKYKTAHGYKWKYK
jgi:hypothetical protein